MGLLDSLVGNHALVDGNKCLGWLAVVVFYGLNVPASTRLTIRPMSWSSLWRDENWLPEKSQQIWPVGTERTAGDSDVHRVGAGGGPLLEAPHPGEKAEALLHSLARHHALVDGNKWLALAAAVAFLGVNGRRLTLTNDEAYHLVMEVAAGHLHDVVDLAETIRIGSEPR